jgi:hypothetical protein
MTATTVGNRAKAAQKGPKPPAVSAVLNPATKSYVEHQMKITGKSKKCWRLFLNTLLISVLSPSEIVPNKFQMMV